ncbi:MAG: DegT/DnrJ/EryC1/StrS family aminotransferase [Myxococcota bacterium]
MTTEPVPFLDLSRPHQALAASLADGFAEAVRTTGFIGGPRVETFEADFARFCGAEKCIGVANGTDALFIALKALGVGPGDVVLVPSFTFVATAEAVSILGATPRFVEVDPHTFTITADTLAKADATNVKAVIPVHLFGQCADMQPIMTLAKKHGWRVLEDAAQAHGATDQGRAAGALGDLAAFSFYPTKNLGAIGDAGAITGPSGETLERARRLANHGRLGRYEHAEPGFNSRLDSIQAMALSLKLRHLNDWNARRGAIAAMYDERLKEAGVITPSVRNSASHVYHLYVIQVEQRERLQKALDADRIGHGVHYGLPLHLQPAYAGSGQGKGALPITERVAERVLSLPMFPELSESQVDRVVRVVRAHARAGS